MKIESRETKRQLFICSNFREGKEACGPKGADDLHYNLKIRLKDAGLWNEYKVTKCGCLGPCATGMNAVLMPENKMLSNIQLSDEDEIYKLLTLN